MAYCFLHHSEEKEMLVAEAGTVTQVCSFITSHVMSVVCRPGSFHDLKRCQYVLFLLIFKIIIAYELHSSSFLFPLLTMLKQTLFKLNSVAFI